MPSRPTRELPRDSRICLVSSFPPMRCGLGDYTQNLAKELSDLGVEVHILTFRLEGLQAYQKLGSSLHIWRVLSGFRERRAVLEVLNKIEPSILHVQSTTFRYPWSFYSLFVTRPRYPLVVTAHDVPSYRVLRMFPLLDLMYNRANKIIALSRKMALRLTQLHRVPMHKIVLMPHGTNTDRYGPGVSPRLFRERFSILPDTFVILFFGFIRPGKGIEHLLEAYSLAKDRMGRSKLVVAGGLPSNDYRSCSYYAKILRKIHELGVSTTTKMTGFVDDEMIPSCFAAADLVVLPYDSDGADFSESGPLAIALSSARPIIATCIPGADQILQNEVNAILVEPRDPSALAQAIIQLHKDARLRRALMINARLTAEELSFSKVARKQIELYSKLINELIKEDPSSFLVSWRT